VIEAMVNLASVIYLIVCFVLIILSLHRGERIFGILKAELPAETWERLGSPSSLWDLFKNPSASWRAFIRDRAYEAQISAGANEQIRAERRRIYAFFTIALALGLLLIVWTQLGRTPPSGL
jgi:cbb3-type cytochrome oxidase subunit 3